MTSKGLGEMFEGDFADTCAVKFPLVSMGGRAGGLACTDPGARTPFGASGNLSSYGASVAFPQPWPASTLVMGLGTRAAGDKGYQGREIVTHQPNQISVGHNQNCGLFLFLF